MAKNKLDLTKLDEIINKTIEVINSSKSEIFDIAELARKESLRLEEELRQLKEQVIELIESVEILEANLKESRRRLMLVNKNHQKYNQQELKEAYEKADNIRVELAVKREREQFYLRRRNDLEIRIKLSYQTIQKADNLISQVGAALSYLTGDLKEISHQLENLQHKQLLGISIIRAQEDERQRVARDIHDGPAQSMSNIVLKAEICERLMDDEVDKAKEELRSLKKIVRDCLQDVRKIIYNLRPMSLDDLGLVPTLQRYVLTFQDDTGILISFKARGEFESIQPIIALTVFRIVQEALSNVNKHAMAGNVVINLEVVGEDFKLYIYDDGKGFEVESLKTQNENMNSGFGLSSMRERVELLRGEFRLVSEPGKGTRINISIPLKQEEEGSNG